MQTKIKKSAIRSGTTTFTRYWLPAVAAALILWSCLATSPPGNPEIRPLPIRTIWAGSQCGCEARQPLIRWVTDQSQLTAAMAAAGSKALEAQLARHPMDWTRRGIVWICMGLKPSGGYALSLAAPVANVSAGVAMITVRWRQPRPGSVVTQQLTSPCLLLSLARDGFHTLQINDEAGRVRASLEMNNE